MRRQWCYSLRDSLTGRKWDTGGEKGERIVVNTSMCQAPEVGISQTSFHLISTEICKVDIIIPFYKLGSWGSEN